MRTGLQVSNHYFLSSNILLIFVETSGNPPKFTPSKIRNNDRTAKHQRHNSRKTPQEATSLLDDTLTAHPDDAAGILRSLTGLATQQPSLMIEIGKRFWKLGLRGEAMSAYETAAKVDPDGPAGLLIEHSNSIMDFFNPDLLNP